MTTNHPAPLKILMLHGYTQSGSLFYAKSRSLEKRLQKAFPNVQLIYPTGPMKLDPKDVPGFESSESSEDIEAYGWWRRSNTAEPPEYMGMDDGMRTIANALAEEGPFDGVIGFSQGASAAVMVSSLLEGRSRKEAFEEARKRYPEHAIPYPAAFETLQHPSLKFCIEYCGFRAPGERYVGYYEPPVKGPILHVLGSLDSVVEESRSRALIEACGGEEKTKVVWHPGGHFLPGARQYLDIAVDFIRQSTEPNPASEAKEQSVEEMDVPF
ncbi:MAG: hypothetical protein Q9227_001162 [Pyrenula ochraceoflavens]